MSLQFTQEEVERELADAMPHTVKTNVARVSHLPESTIKRQFNPDDEAASCAFRTLQVGCALDEIDETLGDRFWLAIFKFRELSKKRKPGKTSNLNLETGKLNKEMAEFISSKLEGKPFQTQMKELLEAQAQLDVVKEELIKEFNRLKGAE